MWERARLCRASLQLPGAAPQHGHPQNQLPESSGPCQPPSPTPGPHPSLGALPQQQDALQEVFRAGTPQPPWHAAASTPLQRVAFPPGELSAVKPFSFPCQALG